MGREIRRVPPGWEHPRRDDGEYIPLYDEDFASVARAWLDDAIAWDNGSHKDVIDDPALKHDYPFFWQWDADPPDPESYRPVWTEEPTAYQVYETVSEGTPVSPVFKTLDDLVTWMVGEGYSEHAARRFAESGYAPSMTIVHGAHGNQLVMNAHIYDFEDSRADSRAASPPPDDPARQDAE